MTTGVRCDEPGCGWTEATPRDQVLGKWYMKPCPRCGKGIIINRLEKCVLLLIRFLMAVGLAETIEEGKPTRNGFAKVRIDMDRRPGKHPRIDILPGD